MLYQQFQQESPRSNPPGMSEQLRFLFWVADKRGKRANPPSQDQAAYWDLEAIEEAGSDMGMSGYQLQAFVSNAASWF